MSSPAASVLRRPTAMERVSVALFIGLHAALLLTFFVRFSWPMVALALGGYVLRMWAITAGYHRYFAHRSYKTSRAWQLVLAVLGATAMQNGPIWWASAHRRHHKHSDGSYDPHSPLQRGLWHAHVGWVFERTTAPRLDRSNVRDLLRYPELRWIDGHDWLPVLTYAAACFVIGGPSGVVWGFVVSTLAVFHATMLINSLAHVWGSQRYVTGDGSRNNAFLAALTFGEGWHNNHHHCMSSARQGFTWWEFDPSYWTLKVLSWFGVVWDVRGRAE